VKSPANEQEHAELSRALDQLAERASALDSAQLVSLWPELEARVLARVSADEHRHETPLLHAESERIRNLAWEIGVSVDLHAVHLGALRTLADLLRERGQRLGRRGASSARDQASLTQTQDS
jgi:hypothetical protein